MIPKTLKETYELTHHQMIDLKALMGDPSDNIPGIPGVGEKTAVKLLLEYETLENVLAHKEDIKGKLGERIMEHEELAKLSKELVTIDCDANIEISVNDLIIKETKSSELASFFQSLDLHVFVKKMDQVQTNPTWDYQLINDEEVLKKYLKKI